MHDSRTTIRLLDWKPIGRRIRGRSRKRWIADVLDGLRSINVRGWRRLCAERMEWKKLLSRLRPKLGWDARTIRRRSERVQKIGEETCPLAGMKV